MLRFAVRSFC